MMLITGILFALILIVKNGPQNFSHPSDHWNDKCIAHAEVAETFRHACIGPIVFETLNTFSLNWGENSNATGLRIFDNMGGSVS